MSKCSLCFFCSRFRLLCPDHSRAEQAQHDGRNTLLDGTRGGDPEGVWPKGGYLVSGNHGDRNGGGRTALFKWESTQGKTSSTQPKVRSCHGDWILRHSMLLFHRHSTWLQPTGLQSCRIQRDCHLSSETSSTAVWRWMWTAEALQRSCFRYLDDH